MKIATITCHKTYNYGAVLQAYALQKHLTDKGHYVDILDYVPEYLAKNDNLIKHILKTILRFPDRYKGKKIFSKFIDTHIKLSDKTFYSYKDLLNYNNIYDCYITGSDQVWNMNMKNGNDPSYFLRFAPNGSKKISYAASIAMDSLNNDQQIHFKKSLCDYAAVSVREDSGVKLLENIGIECSHVCDPVYLLNADQWSKIASDKKYDEPYILVYAFYGQKDVYEYAKRIAKENKCKVYSIGTKYSTRFSGCDKYFWCVSPTEFINLIRKAKYVVTNSFHGLSFSVIYNRPITVFKTNKKGNSRIIDMLKSIDAYSDNNSSIVAKIESYSDINNKIKDLVIHSEQFIERCGL